MPPLRVKEGKEGPLLAPSTGLSESRCCRVTTLVRRPGHVPPRLSARVAVQPSARVALVLCLPATIIAFLSVGEGARNGMTSVPRTPMSAVRDIGLASRPNGVGVRVCLLRRALQCRLSGTAPRMLRVPPASSRESHWRRRSLLFLVSLRVSPTDGKMGAPGRYTTGKASPTQAIAEVLPACTAAVALAGQLARTATTAHG
mmetsp:Transcript_6493/g.24138  ORF Transcript_6493/g.24138 Transcript_6493/m.24138 type:complete len:201 (+) Transcript_6493:1395-1997(+)